MKPELIVNISQIFIFIGVILTAVGGFGSHWASNKVQESKNIAASENEAKLNQSISELLEGNKVLKTKIEPFEDLAHKIYPAIERTEALDKLRVEFEQLRQRADELEKAAAPRKIPEDKKAIIINELKKYQGSKIYIASASPDNEAMLFAQQIQELFINAGWSVSIGSITTFTPVNGISVITHDNPQPKYQAIVPAVFQYLNIPISFNYQPLNEGSKSIGGLNQFRILVGSKIVA